MRTLDDDEVNSFSVFGEDFKEVVCCWVCLSL